MYKIGRSGVQISPTQNLFEFKSTKISLRKSEQKKKGALSLIAQIRAVSVREEEETRREEKEKEVEASFEASILCDLTVFV